MVELKKASILFIFITLILNCTQSGEFSPIHSHKIEMKQRQQVRDSCLNYINKKILGITSSREKLQKWLSLDSIEAEYITTKDVQGKNPLDDQRVIGKLIPLIIDTTLLNIQCNYFNGSQYRKGDLAILSIYMVKEFPFATALGRQWCVGGKISENIRLPYNLIEYTNFKRELIHKSYEKYYHENLKNKNLKEK